MQVNRNDDSMIIYEDQAVIVICKPSGLPSAPLDSKLNAISAVSLVLQTTPSCRNVVGFKKEEFGLLNRLDTDTSGLLVFAKNQSTFNEVRELWSSGAVRKFYYAYCELENGATLSKNISYPFDLEGEIGREKGRASRVVLSRPSCTWLLQGQQPVFNYRKIRGKPLPARTRVYSIQEIQPGLVEVFLEIFTGVSHQIRCQLAAAGLPLVGDTIYGYRGASRFPMSRLGLHAFRIEFSILGRLIKVQTKRPHFLDINVFE